MVTIFKYPIRMLDVQQVSMPAGAVPLHVGLCPDGLFSVWAKVDRFAHQVAVDIHVRATGQPVEEFLSYIGTAVIGDYVWHVFYENVAQ